MLLCNIGVNTDQVFNQLYYVLLTIVLLFINSNPSSINVINVTFFLVDLELSPEF
jgi:hypothetical protein